MAVKFPLEMKNGVMVRNMRDLKENFDIEKIVSYFLEGKLLTWLEARYYEDEAEVIERLSKDDPEIAKKLCEIFNVEYIPTEVIDTRKVIEQNERLLKLKQFTEDEVVADNIDFVAFEQSELIDLVHGGSECIYMCGESFVIPLKEGVKYIGINEPEVSFESENVMKLYIDNKIEVLKSKFSPTCQKEINRKKNYRIEARITKFYEHEENEEYEELQCKCDIEGAENYIKNNTCNIFKIYNTWEYLGNAQRQCELQYKIKVPTMANDKFGRYKKINCLYRIFDDKEELLFGKKIGIKRYAVTEKYVFFTGCLWEKDVLYVFDKKTELISLLKEAKEIKLVGAYDDKCIFGRGSYASTRYYSLDISGKETDLKLWGFDGNYEWNKDGDDIYEGYVQDGIFYRSGENGIFTFDLNTGETGKIYNKGKLIRKIIINANTMYFCQNDEILAYSLSDKSLKKLVQGKYYTQIIKITGNKLIYSSDSCWITPQKYELDLNTLKSKAISK